MNSITILPRGNKKSIELNKIPLKSKWKIDKPLKNKNFKKKIQINLT